ncbi:hypothetical protein ABIB06_000178 [Bradyrhizobium sp. LB8.2]
MPCCRIAILAPSASTSGEAPQPFRIARRQHETLLAAHERDQQCITQLRSVTQHRRTGGSGKIAVGIEAVEVHCHGRHLVALQALQPACAQRLGAGTSKRVTSAAQSIIIMLAS